MSQNLEFERGQELLKGTITALVVSTKSLHQRLHMGFIHKWSFIHPDQIPPEFREAFSYVDEKYRSANNTVRQSSHYQMIV